MLNNDYARCPVHGTWSLLRDMDGQHLVYYCNECHRVEANKLIYNMIDEYGKVMNEYGDHLILEDLCGS
jgi:hypothetical protein